MIHFIIALPSEARPLIDHYQLKIIPRSGPFKLYEANGRRLIISGVGKIQSAGAAAFLHAFSGSLRNRIWVNVGIGGHVAHTVGEGVLAHKITDRTTGESWYPPIVIEPPCRTESILTVDHPESKYWEPSVYEMEAAGFYPAATRFSTGELVHCYKVISDNRKSPPHKISSTLVERLIAGHLEAIDTILKRTEKLATGLPNLLEKRTGKDSCLSHFLERWHFTVTEQHRLRRFLARLGTLEPKAEVFSKELKTLARSKDVLQFLEDKINSLPVRL